MKCKKIVEYEDRIAALQQRVAALETSLAAINGAARLIQQSMEPNQGLLDEAGEARLDYILEESDLEPKRPFQGELPEAVVAFLRGMQ